MDVITFRILKDMALILISTFKRCHFYNGYNHISEKKN